MPTIDTYRKQAKLLVRWHRERNYSLGARVRRIERFAHLTDVEVLDAPFPLTLAQEVIAAEAGYSGWEALRSGHVEQRAAPDQPPGEPVVKGATPILFVRNVADSARFYEEKLGFAIDFLHGKPPFYASVSRGGACLHLRYVHRPNFAELAAREGSLILATIEVSNVKALFEACREKGVDFPQRLTRQAWGGLDFHIRDPDGNTISFVEFPPAATDQGS